jgi:hypothetical protein
MLATNHMGVLSLAQIPTGTVQISAVGTGYGLLDKG